jgi:hypothetical protein
LRETSTCMHQWVHGKLHLHLSPWLPESFRGGGHGVGATPVYGGLATQVSAHLPEKYDGMVNPAEFLQIYSTSILTARGNEAIMANYFPVALTGTTRFWLMNLLEGTLHSWSELCRQFTANFESAYARPGNETDLHTIQQCSEESPRSFVQWFSYVRNTIPHMSNASVVVAFLQGVRDEKMLEKLTTHDVQDVSTPFSLTDKCTRAAEGHTWHSLVA